MKRLTLALSFLLLTSCATPGLEYDSISFYSSLPRCSDAIWDEYIELLMSEPTGDDEVDDLAKEETERAHMCRLIDPSKGDV